MIELPADWQNYQYPVTQPRYPIYVPTKGRWQNPLTIRCLQRAEIPFYAVIEQEEYEQYAAVIGDGPGEILVLPESGKGLFESRNFIKRHSIANGDDRHWQLDDNIREMQRLWKDRRLKCSTGPAIRVMEDFTDRYSNISVSGPNYVMFGVSGTQKPFSLNVHVYSATLVNNEVPISWRLLYNDDTDYCLQSLAAGWCTVLVNAFLAYKLRTMIMGGGNTDDLYQADGRLKMARMLERYWPGVVSTDRRWQRPQHIVAGAWKKFDTQLKLKPGIDLEAMPKVDEYGLKLKAVAPVKSEYLKKKVGLVDDEKSANFAETAPETSEQGVDSPAP